VQLGHLLVGLCGNDSARFDCLVIVLPRLPQARKTDRIIILAMNVVGLLWLYVSFPFVEPTDGNQAAPGFICTPEGWLSRDRLCASDLISSRR
jgi:hypothetical protein